jgi:alkylation response protein AidB-like acyl-CoA dehydrogenase
MDLTTLTRKLRKLETEVPEAEWSSPAIEVLREAGCWGASIAKQYGGRADSPAGRFETYEAVAAGSLTMALVLTQHDAACELLGDCENPALAGRLLPAFASGELLTTVGISQLTTSRRGSGPAMRAERGNDSFQMTGLMPWVTSARFADYVVTGAVLQDGQQILACIPLDAAGVRIGQPMRLMALDASWTSEVYCDDVEVRPEWLMRGPCEKVLASRAPVKGFTVSAVGIGMAGALLDMIRQKGPSLGPSYAEIEAAMTDRYNGLRGRLFTAADSLSAPAGENPAMAIRTEVNDLLVRLAGTCLTVAKGTGYTAGHPAQRLVREAMFFLVWSAPTDVQVGTLQRLWP